MAGDWLGGKLAGRLKIANADENGLFEARATLSGVSSYSSAARGAGPRTRLSARTRTRTGGLPGRRTSIRSSTAISRVGLTDCPPASTRPASISCVARLRVL